MANVRKHGSKWQVQVRRQGRQLTRSFVSKGDADTWARIQESRFDRADLPPDPRTLRSVTLGDLLRRYRDEVTPRKRSAAHERNRISRLLRHDLSALSLDRLGSADFKLFRDERLGSVGPQAVRHDLNLLGHVLRIASQEWEVPVNGNPVSKIAKPTIPRHRERRLGPGEWEALEKEARCSTHPAYLIGLLRTAVETAMRKGELLALRPSDIDSAASVARVRESKNGLPRTVPLSPVALVSIRQQESSEKRVFPTSIAALRFHWERLLSAVGIDDLHFHDLRHEAVSRLFERGLSVAEVALISGHKDVRQLFRYTHPRAEDIVRKLAK